LLVLIFVFLLINISAECNETQIDINTASLEELDMIIGIGPAYALRIIEGRSFNSVEGLLDVPGIGPTTLEKIKQQGLACVNKEVETEEEENEIEEPKDTENETETENNEETENLIYENFSQMDESVELNPIVLNAKSIKSEDDNSNLRRNLALSGIVTFCVIFGALFLFKNRRRKNEFQ